MNGWRHVKDTRPRARKPHTCLLCERTIEPGQVYVRRDGFQDGKAETFAMHERCEAVTQEWDEGCWLYHDPVEFRECDLGEAVSQ